MKRSALLLMCCALLLVSCKEKVDNKTLLQGCWVCNDINNITIPTDTMIVMNFDENSGVIFSQGIEKDASHAEFVSLPLSYQVDEQSFTLSGVNADKETVNLRFEISSISEQKLIANLLAENQGLKSGKYTFRKIVTPNKNLTKIQGEWEGYMHIADRDCDTLYESEASIKMKFEGDDSYVFYKNINGSWQSCDGTFSLYGDWMAVNYATEFSSYYKCWEFISVSENKMMIQKYNKSPGSSLLGIVKYKMIKL